MEEKPATLKFIPFFQHFFNEISECVMRLLISLKFIFLLQACKILFFTYSLPTFSTFSLTFEQF